MVVVVVPEVGLRDKEGHFSDENRGGDGSLESNSPNSHYTCLAVTHLHFTQGDLSVPGQ